MPFGPGDPAKQIGSIDCGLVYIPLLLKLTNANGTLTRFLAAKFPKLTDTEIPEDWT